MRASIVSRFARRKKCDCSASVVNRTADTQRYVDVLLYCVSMCCVFCQYNYVSPFCIQVKHCATAHHSKFVAENADAYQLFLVEQKKELLEFRLQSIRAKQRASYGEVSAPIAIPRCMVYKPVVSYKKVRLIIDRRSICSYQI